MYEVTTTVPITPDDVASALATMREYALEMDLPFAGDHFLPGLSALAVGGNSFFMVAKDENGEVVGISLMIIFPNIYNQERLEARELIWHVHPRLSVPDQVHLKLRLLDQMLDICKRLGLAFHMTAKALDPGVKSPRILNPYRMLNSRGFKMTEINYIKEAI